MGLFPPRIRGLLRKRNLLSFVLVYILLRMTILHKDSYIMRGGPRPKPVDLYLYDHNEIKYLPYEFLMRYSSVVAAQNEASGQKQIQWGKYAYITYATDSNYLCNAIMNLARLKSTESLSNGEITKADLVLLYRSDFYYVEGKPRSQQTSIEGRLLADAVDKFGIKVKSVPVLWFESDISSWSQSFTKYWIFDQVEYERLIYFDSDSRVSQKMDELFFLPDSSLYMPVSYQNFQVGLTKFDSYSYKNEKLMDISERQEYINGITNDLGDFVDANKGDDKQMFKSSAYDNLPSMTGFLSQLIDAHKATIDKNLHRDKYDVEEESVLSKFKLSDHIMVIKPDHRLFKSLLSFTSYKQKNEYDMDVLNNFVDIMGIFEGSKSNEWLIASNEYDKPDKYIPLITILPHQNLGLLTGEFRKDNPEDHDYYLADVVDYPQIRYFQNQYRRYQDTLNEYERDKRKMMFKNDATEEDTVQELGEPPRSLKIPYWSHLTPEAHALADEGEGGEGNRNHAYKFGWNVNSTVSNWKLIHFSDYPIPKPWKIQYPDEHRENRVMCRDNGNPDDKRFSVAGYKVLNDCDSVRFWNYLYSNFASDRLEFCGLELVP